MSGRRDLQIRIQVQRLGRSTTATRWNYRRELVEPRKAGRFPINFFCSNILPSSRSA